MAKTAQEIIDEEKKKAQDAQAKAFAEGGMTEQQKAEAKKKEGDKKSPPAAVDKDKEKKHREKLKETTKPDFSTPLVTGTGKE